ncbi:MAG: SUMF1/EgtB/PvdO family nonheme iron enzyme [Gemmatales bacterium]
MAHDVFISYSSADKSVADAVCAALEQQKIRCWIAPRDVLAGTTWGDSIVRAIGDSKAMVLIFSGRANESVQIKREVERAVHKAIPILPFRIENVLPSGDLEYFLSLPHWLDAMTPPLEGHLRLLTRTVETLLEQPAGSGNHAVSAALKSANPKLRRMQRRSFPTIVVVGLLLVVIVGLGLWAWNSRHRDRPVAGKPIPIKMVLIPAGEFRMGVNEAPQSLLAMIPPGESLSLDEQRPPHRVRITRPFYLGACEVTVGQFRAFIDATGYETDAERDGGGTGLNPNTLRLAAGPKYTWKFTGFPQTDEHPVVNVSWNDAVAFCAWMSKQEGATYRLPTEAEWEYACRAGSNSYFGQGDEPQCLEAYANLADVAMRKKMGDAFFLKSSLDWNDGYPFTSPVGSFKPNAWGLYDMHGNVGEWCADWYEATAYRTGDRVDPSGPASGTHRVRRGSFWWDSPVWSGASQRSTATPDEPELDKPEYRCMNYGFRVVKQTGP